jgi:hypothetical protein
MDDTFVQGAAERHVCRQGNPFREGSGRSELGTARRRQLFKTFSAFLALETRRMSSPFFASGGVAQ